MTLSHRKHSIILIWKNKYSMYLVKHSDSLQDFVFCKKKIRKFKYRWNTDDMLRFKPNTYYRKLFREYNHQLRERSHRWTKEK